MAGRPGAFIGSSSSAPSRWFVVSFAIGLLSWIAGAVLVAIPFIRHRAGPAWVGYVLLASSVALVVGNLLIAPSGPASNLALNLISNMGPVLLLAAIGYVGFRLWSEYSAAPVSP